jgi:hypothetical protein
VWVVFDDPGGLGNFPNSYGVILGSAHKVHETVLVFGGSRASSRAGVSASGAVQIVSSAGQT